LCPFAVRRIFRRMSTLGRNDLASVLDFLGDVAALESDDPYPLEFIARLQGLVPSDAITYQDVEHGERRTHVMVEFEPDRGAEDAEALEIYWQLGPCPTGRYRDVTGDLHAIRMSDVVDRRTFHELAIYREYFLLCGTEHLLDFALPAQAGHHRGFLFFRDVGNRDFTERDLAVLEMLRPHLYRMESHAALRRQVADELRWRAGADEGRPLPSLTPRERAVVELVAEGKTNTEIAAALWIAPSTVKKHLENIYAKIGVGRRAAAVAAARLGNLSG
jgi:DNA-binding CsgD family transcriptional regulator